MRTWPRGWTRGCSPALGIAAALGAVLVTAGCVGDGGSAASPGPVPPVAASGAPLPSSSASPSPPAAERGADPAAATARANEETPVTDDLPKSDAEWKEKLTPEQFYVCRMQGTERPFTGAFWSSKEEGTYTCIACGEALFSSETKYDSGSGWPSYWEPIAETAVAEHTDRSHGMVRTEVTCKRCGSHLGHVFPDGPRPTGLRYCINSAALGFVPAKAPE